MKWTKVTLKPRELLFCDYCAEELTKEAMVMDEDGEVRCVPCSKKTEQGTVEHLVDWKKFSLKPGEKMICDKCFCSVEGMPLGPADTFEPKVMIDIGNGMMQCLSCCGEGKPPVKDTWDLW